MNFVVEIELGNDGMQTLHEVREAIVESLVSSQGMYSPLELEEEQSIRDGNGNTVGRWRIEPAFTPGLVDGVPREWLEELANRLEDSNAVALLLAERMEQEISGAGEPVKLHAAFYWERANRVRKFLRRKEG